MIGKYLGLDRKDNFTSYDVNKEKFYGQIEKNKSKWNDDFNGGLSGGLSNGY